MTNQNNIKIKINLICFSNNVLTKIIFHRRACWVKIITQIRQRYFLPDEAD